MNKKTNCYNFVAELKRKKRTVGCKKAILLYFLLLFASTGLVNDLWAQNETIIVSGQVTDAFNAPLIGVSVMEVGKTTNGTVTDWDGNYSLSVSSTSKVKFSYLGYKPIERNAASIINVIMEEDATGLEEVVVVAYGTQRKKDLTGAISVVDTDRMKKLQTADIGMALQGMAPGVNVTSSGLPGSQAEINIRGIGSFSTTGPLYVIDGVIMQGGQREFNMNDVESLQVLKDAASSALYGARGANGVILITTKKGKSGETKIDVNASYGISEIAKRLDMMQSIDFLNVQRLAYENANRSWPGKPQYGQVLHNTDWQDAFFKTGYATDINLSVSGGNEHGNYMFSGNFYDQDGVVIGPSHRRFNIRSNSEARKGIFTIGENFTFGRSISVPMEGSPFVDLARMVPTIPVYDPNNEGEYGYGSAAYPTYGSNPIGLQELRDNKQFNNRMVGNAYLQIEPIKGLKIKTDVGVEYFDYYDKNKLTTKQVRYLTVPDYRDQLQELNGETLSLIWESTAFYQNKIGVHAFDALLGYTAQKTERHGNTAMIRNLATPGFWVLDQKSGEDDALIDVSGSESVYTMTSILGRVNYSYADRYLVQFNVRRDGSSRFGKNYRIGTFPSASLGWRLSQEEFMESVGWLNDLKLRTSYGVLGDQDVIPSYAFANYIHPQEGAIFGSDIYYDGKIQKGFANADLRWEQRKTFNLGLDFSVLNQRLYGSIEYFNSRISDLLVKRDLAWTTGTDESDYPWSNYGAMRNQGVELSLGFRDRAGDFKYDVSTNLSGVRNKVLTLANDKIYFGGSDGVSATEVGRSIGDFKVLRTNGIFQTQEEIDNYTRTILDEVTGIEITKKIQPNAQPGDIRYKDLNGDGVIDMEDREYMGSPFPKIEGSLNLYFEYKGIDLNLYFYGVCGNYIYNGVRRTLESMNDVSNFPANLKPWTGEGTSNTTPRPYMGQTDNTLPYTDRWLERGDYLRLKNIQLGYSLPSSWLAKTDVIERCRIYFSGQNLFTLTGYSGFDPEISGGNPYGKGYDNGHFPPVRSYSFGLQVSF